MDEWNDGGFAPRGADSETADTDIQAMLDLGYEQLDGFLVWLEEKAGIGTRVAQQDCFNAECLIDYLANHQHKTVAECDEFDLRWFMFSHYIRKAMADPETEERLPASLERFFAYLEYEHHETFPSWLRGVLEDSAFFQRRRQAFQSLDANDERAWEQGFRAWSAELEDDLDARALWLPREMGEGMQWGDVMGWREATLYEEANRQWQRERRELLGEGLDVETARDYLTSSYRVWLDTPDQRLDDMTPREVIVIERQERADAEPDEDSEEEEDEFRH